MEKHTVYILKCSDNSFYTGLTSRNIDERIAEHNSGDNRTAYTFKRRPVKLLWYSEFSDLGIAKEKESQIKGWSRRKKQALIDGDFDLLIEYSKNNQDKNDPSTSSG